MNETALFQSGNDLNAPACLCLDPRLKRGGIAGVSHGGSGDDARAVCTVLLDSALETLESAEGGSHRIR